MAQSREEPVFSLPFSSTASGWSAWCLHRHLSLALFYSSLWKLADSETNKPVQECVSSIQHPGTGRWTWASPFHISLWGRLWVLFASLISFQGGACECHRVRMWSQYSLQELVFCFHHVDPRGQTQVWALVASTFAL